MLSPPAHHMFNLCSSSEIRSRALSRLVFLIVFAAALVVRQAVLPAETLRIDEQGIGTSDAPPRGIHDITAVLDRERESLKAVEVAIKIAERAVPEGAKSGVLAKFFRERARAAHFLGRFEQEVADYRSAIEHSRLSGKRSRNSPMGSRARRSTRRQLRMHRGHCGDKSRPRPVRRPVRTRLFRCSEQCAGHASCAWR